LEGRAVSGAPVQLPPDGRLLDSPVVAWAERILAEAD